MMIISSQVILSQLLVLLNPGKVGSFLPAVHPRKQFCFDSQRQHHHLYQNSKLIVGTSSSSDQSTEKKKNNSGIKKKKPKKYSPSYLSPSSPQSSKNKKTSSPPSTLETWRIYSIAVHPDDLAQDDIDGKTNLHESSSSSNDFPNALLSALKAKLKLDEIPTNSTTTIVRRSLDARKIKSRGRRDPMFNYVVDITISGKQRRSLGWNEKSGKMERLGSDELNPTNPFVSAVAENSRNTNSTGEEPRKKKKTVVICGMGPAGLFCALQLALQSNNTVRPVLLDRGQPVEKRGRDIGALMHRRSLDEESNFAFGEGGAGTWSDGKLTTRIGRNSETVRWVLQTLVDFGAPSNILWEGAPHLGTDNLVRLLRNMRRRLQELGGEIHFGTKMTDIKMDGGKVCAMLAKDEEGNDVSFDGDAFVLATGHSARDVYESLHNAGVKLEPKGFAVGFRIEHPQAIINQIQYGEEWGPCVMTGKGLTDTANSEFFGTEPQHIAKMPVPSYRLATDKARDGHGQQRGVYSFCMCPGGQIVPSSTDPKEVCVNGMSFSRRDSKWANSALVVTISPDDEVLKDYAENHGVLAGLEFQRDMERKASILGGGNLTVPVQRMTDFCEGKMSETIPSSSYRLGVKSAPCHEIYPEPITNALRDALTNHFKNQMPGYFHKDGLLHAVETRTSSPLRVPRDADTFTAVGADNLYPSGEGAGYAGGIISAAVDGVNVAEALLDNLCGGSRLNRAGKAKSIGFSY